MRGDGSGGPRTRPPPIGPPGEGSRRRATTAASAVALTLAWGRLTAAVLPPAAAVAAVAAGRVFVGAHYPHDVVAAFALGGFVAALFVTTSAERPASVVDGLACGARDGIDGLPTGAPADMRAAPPKGRLAR